MTDNINRLQFLAWKWVTSAEGQELFHLIKLQHSTDPVFPQPPEKLEAFGGATGYAAHRSGQLDLLTKLETLAMDYSDRIKIENQKEKEINESN